MLPRADITGTRALAHIEALSPVAPAGDARHETFNRLAQIAIGKQIQAEVLSRLNDGTFVVRIENTSARMNLPDGARVGDTLDLTMVAAQPRPTFMLGQQPRAAIASLSFAGRLIDSLLQGAQGAPTSLVGKAPLLASPAAGTSQVAAALQNTLASSGLFYESHLRQWANGGRALADLMQEPQTQYGNLALKNGEPQTVTPRADLARLVANTRASVDGDRALTAPMRDSPLQNVKIDAADVDGQVQLAAMNSDAAHMINLQIDALEQRRVLWQGELWSGQPLEWEVAEEAPDNAAENSEQRWRSVVHFALPTLGAVTATIWLAGGHVQMQIRTAGEAAAASLRAHGSMLAGALDAAGSPLDSLTVKQDE